MEEKDKVKAEAEAEQDPLEKAQEENKELNDRLLRQMAEFENFRKRTEKEKSAMSIYSWLSLWFLTIG